MNNLVNIDINKIDSKGRYVNLDQEHPEIFHLPIDVIQKLREYYHNPNIAAEVKIPQKSSSNQVVKKQPPISKNRPKFRLCKEKSQFNNGHHYTKTPPRIKYGRTLLVGGLAITFSMFLFGSIYASNKDVSVNYDPSSYIEENFNPLLVSHLVNDVGLNYFHTVNNSSTIEDIDSTPSEELSEVEQLPTKAPNIVSTQRKLIDHFSDIYHVDSDVVYNRLVELTDNFSSEDYLVNFHIAGVTCKSQEVYASTEEELLFYAVRCISYLPDQMGVSQEALFVDNGYTSGTDYMQQVSEAARITGVDRCLLYAICRTECGFKSDMFMHINNPAGLKLDGIDWEFPTTEAGFLETCLEIIKYYRMMDRPLTDVSHDAIKQISIIHRLGYTLDNIEAYSYEDPWTPLVCELLEYAKANEQDIFGDTSHSLSH